MTSHGHRHLFSPDPLCSTQPQPNKNPAALVPFLLILPHLASSSHSSHSQNSLYSIYSSLAKRQK